MMRTCNKCGMGDDFDNMYYVTDNETDTMQCVCDVCSKQYKNAIPVMDVSCVLQKEKRFVIKPENTADL